MDKFKGKAIGGIQSHNQRERKSNSNPDIILEKSNLNYDLHNEGRISYQQSINNRIDSLNLKKAPRHDAIQMCGIIVSSNKEFFQNMNESEQKRFFKSAKEWLGDFVGQENIISANLHLDEKTPHLHFCHVPVTPDGRLCAKEIYTRISLKKMQSELPKYLQSIGFKIERGVIQESGSAKKHLDTREFKQQQTALEKLCQESDLEASKLENLKQRVVNFKKMAAKAETILEEKPGLPLPGIFKAQAIYDAATDIISLYQESLADKQLVNQRNKYLEQCQATVDEQIKAVEEKSLKKIIEVEQKADKEIHLKSLAAKNLEKELNEKLQKAIQRVNQSDQSFKDLMANLKILLTKIERLKGIEKEWLKHKQQEKMVELLRQEEERALVTKKRSGAAVVVESQAKPSLGPAQPPKKQSGAAVVVESQAKPSLSPAQPPKNPNRGWSR